MSTTNRSSRRLPPPSSNGTTSHAQPAPDSSILGKSSRHRKVRRKPRGPKRIKRRDAVEAIRDLAARVGSNDLRRPMAAFARAIANAKKERPVMEPGGPLDVLLTAAEGCDGVADKVRALEAATWGLGRLVRSKRAGKETSSTGTADTAATGGAALERLVQAANAFVEPLDAGDLTGAAFVFVLGRLFSDVDACGRLGTLAVSAFERRLQSVVPSGGPIKQTGADQILRTVALWAGVHARAEATGEVPWGERTREVLLSAVETAVRLMHFRGSTAPPRRSKATSEWEVILDVGRRLGAKPLATTATLIAEGGEPVGGLSRDIRYDDAGLAIIRSGWRRRDVRVLVDARQPAMHLEVSVGDRRVVAGEWTFAASADGVALEATGPWADSCFESDKDATFLEWTLPLARGLQLERQVVLAPKERVLLLADSIVPQQENLRAASASAPELMLELDYRGTIPVGEGLGLERAEETREVIGFDTAVRFLALPLGLPEWSSSPTKGRFDCEPDRLVLAQRSSVARMHAPVWFDFDASRVGGPLTWRQLTVADNRQNLPVHRGCGYRVQVGTRQWLVYRALDAVRNRSVLGCNLTCEFLLGRIGRTGMVERLIEIQ